jgi:hypothetical protein
METRFNILVKSVVGTCALAVAAGALAGEADGAPSGPVTAAGTVSALEAEGFHVIVNRTGAAPLDQCAVNSVRPGQTFARADSGAPGAGGSIVTTVTSKTVYVDIVC